MLMQLLLSTLSQHRNRLIDLPFGKQQMLDRITGYSTGLLLTAGRDLHGGPVWLVVIALAHRAASLSRNGSADRLWDGAVEAKKCWTADALRPSSLSTRRPTHCADLTSQPAHAFAHSTSAPRVILYSRRGIIEGWDVKIGQMALLYRKTRGRGWDGIESADTTMRGQTSEWDRWLIPCCRAGRGSADAVRPSLFSADHVGQSCQAQARHPDRPAPRAIRCPRC